MNDLTDGIARLTHLGVIRVAGEDAASFLHGQLTQDFALLDSSQARLAAFCTAKGRMLASFIGFKRSDTEVLLICSQDLLAVTLKRLSMFVLRAKVKLSDASADYLLAGLVGRSLEVLAPGPVLIWSKLVLDSAQLIRLYPANGLARALWVGDMGTPFPSGPAINLNTWLWTEVRSAVATVTTPVSELFVPQMLNYESLGGVSFKKGCYPGQEIVARSQFRGTIKRRAYLAHCEQAVAVASEVFDSNETEQSCGLVVQIAAAPQGGYDAIVSLQTNSASSAELHAGSMKGPVLEILPLPYDLLEDI
jgi:tRNA-modifying protein YgfZ